MTADAEPSIGATPARWSDGNFWARVSGAAPVAYAQLASDQEADVAVVGAGIVGLTAAQALAAAGKSVVVLEARRIGEQATGRSTAKVSSQHGLIYSRLIRDFGEKQAGIYAQCNEAAIAHIASLVERTGMDCGFERKPAYIYGQSDAAAKIEEEARAASRLGLPAQVVRETPLPFEVAVALRFDNQAQFNPVLYLRGLAAEVARHAGVHEGCRVVKISKEGGRQIVCTEAGPVLRVRDVVVATQMPIVSDGLFYTRAYPISHPMLAGRIDPARAPDGMYISTSSPSHSFRVHGSGSELYMVAVGGTYKTGETKDEQGLLLELEQFVGREFGVDQPEYRWINEDFQPMDGLPFVGRASGSDQHVYVATGFGRRAASFLLPSKVRAWSSRFMANRWPAITMRPEPCTESVPCVRTWAAWWPGMRPTVAGTVLATVRDFPVTARYCAGLPRRPWRKHRPSAFPKCCA
ncbi:FAD-binding oxidoreductase [Alcaligenaceae bacterium]|nr:FAD-binding oxidoreductase [Alcaligenaceae bacterium]